MIRLRILITAVLLTATGLSLRQARAEAGDPPLSLAWRLIRNLPEGGYLAELTLRNTTTDVLTDDWTLYFNSASRLLPDSVSSGFSLTHINGDFFSLRPTESSLRIEPGGSRTVAWRGSPWAINITDAPSGFYLTQGQRTDGPGKPIRLADPVVDFPPPARLTRGAADQVPVASTASRYLENESLELLPPDQLTKVVPTPVELRSLPGRVILRSSTRILCEPRLAREAKFLAETLGELLGAELPVAELHSSDVKQPDTIRLRLSDVSVAGVSKNVQNEAYELTINPTAGVEIVGNEPAGVFYGLQTLRSLLPIEAYRKTISEIAIDAVRIADAPRFAYRGLHLDVARNFQSAETVKKLLDLMAFYKLNRFHWHLTDDEGWRMEIKRLPELTEYGSRRGHTLDESEHLVPSYGSGPLPDDNASWGSGFYTQEELIEIQRFAHARHIRVIPEIDLPGHARAAVKAMEARRRRLANDDPKSAVEFLLREPGDASSYESVQMWNDNVVDVGLESTYRFITVVVDELGDIYDRAGVPLDSIHFGGDEVPGGAWDASTACRAIAGEDNSASRHGKLQLYFLGRVRDILASRSIRPACWDDFLLAEVEQHESRSAARQSDENSAPTAYVWNSVWGWGHEDAAYRLANAGVDVVLCNATHLYFDLATEKDPWEPGYYWAGFVGAKAPFEFMPLDAFKGAQRTVLGQIINRKDLLGRVQLTAEGARHVLGIQGQLWGENLRGAKALEYMAFPRTIALAERAWATKPVWTNVDDPQKRRRQMARDWNQFANRLGQRELPRLDYLHGGVRYRLPPPGAIVLGDRVFANVAFPGLTIRYTVDGSEPTADDEVFRSAIPAAKVVRLKTFDERGRSSRLVAIPATELDASN